METETIPDAPQILGTAKVLGSVLNTKYNTRESEYLSRLLVEFVIGKPYKWVLMHPEAIFTPDELFLWEASAQRLLAMEPIQYIMGKAWFMDLELFVEPGVLIPRPETEELVVWLLEACPANERVNVLDVGTGSGCLALAIAQARPQAQVTGVEVSEKALAIASKNAESLHIPCAFRLMDVLTTSATDFQDLDYIICNPPYIPQRERETMDENVRDHEPALALFVPDADPLLYYNKVCYLAQHWLRPQGALYFEIHESYGEAVVKLLKGMGYGDVELRKDLSGKDRMVRAVWK